MSTGAVLGLTLFSIALVWGILEYRTLRDKVPDNHITAVIRHAFREEPGVFILFTGAFSYWMGHLFWCECITSGVQAWLW